MARTPGTPNSIWSKRKDNPEAQYTQRKCLNCCTKFDSWGAGNRICNKCKSSDIYRNYQNTTTIRIR